MPPIFAKNQFGREVDSKNFYFERKKKQRKFFSVVDWKLFGRVYQIDKPRIQRQLLGGDVVEEFYKRLNHRIQKVCSRSLKSVQRCFMGEMVFLGKRSGLVRSWEKKIVRACQRWISLAAKNILVGKNSWKICYICSDLKRKRFGKLLQTKKLRIERKIWEKMWRQMFS